ncbi:hypothetical protein HY491_04470 [Candidatus Woesearchaeota archaeon]|nr:hypothetical protein [Candidatus Woesearchaeota archaeon]
MGKAAAILKNARVIILIVALLLAALAIHPVLNPEGITIRSIAKGSAAALAGIEQPSAQAAPTSRERIIALQGEEITSLEQYGSIVSSFGQDTFVTLTTNKRTYTFSPIPITETIILNETELVPKNVTDPETNLTTTIFVEVNKTKTNILGIHELGIRVGEAASSNIRKGLDLQGGTRVVLEPETAINRDDLEFILENMKQRLNVFGLSDVTVRAASDLPTYLGGTGKDFIIVEIAGANEEEVKELLAQQGKFEASIGNHTVFRGGSDILYVCRSADCAGIDPFSGCSRGAEGYFCRFRFSISLSPAAAELQASLTKNLTIIPGSTGDRSQGYLSEKLDLFLDNELVDSLNIGADLKGRAVTDIEISGSGSGVSEQAAAQNALLEMKRLQTILITGSLPVKLSIVKTDSISPALGKAFISNAIQTALWVILAVAAVIFIYYRKLSITLPIMITLLAEVVLLLGVAALIGWNIDLAAIAGIIIVLGTGVDHQIVITDETLRGERYQLRLKDKIKQAFFIIMAAYFTTVVALVPLLFAGAGLLKGFALTSILGISIGVFITRPAYAAIIEILLKDSA